jgi:hypothetical protein
VLDGGRSGEQRLAMQAGPDATGFVGGHRGGVGITPVKEVVRVVEQPVSEVIGVLCWRRLAIAAAKATSASWPSSRPARRAPVRSRSACSAGARYPGW